MKKLLILPGLLLLSAILPCGDTKCADSTKKEEQPEGQQDKDGKNGEWKPVLWFSETDTGLVINKTRSGQLRQMTGSPLLAAWAEVGQISIKPGIGNGKAQIVIMSVPGNGNDRGSLPEDYSIADANADLIG